METRELLEGLYQAILEADRVQSKRQSESIIAAGIPADEAIAVASAAVREVGDRFQAGDIFLPELVTTGEAMKDCMNVLTPHLRSASGAGRAAGKVVLATVKGDVHDIGKSIVSTMLTVSGLDVLDLGVNVSPMEIIEEAQKAGAQIIGLSALMTTSLPYQQEVIDLLKELGSREEFYVIIGGGPVTQEHAHKLGADGWAKNAVGAARVCERLLQSQVKPATSFEYEES